MPAPLKTDPAKSLPEPIDDQAAAFYVAFGFAPLVRRPRTFYLPVATALNLISP